MDPTEEVDETAPSPQPPSQTRQSRGNDDDNEGGEDSDESGADPPTRQSVTAESGVIERVHLERFMCHRLFDIDLGPQVNFIVGENGSGKCLGKDVSVLLADATVKPARLISTGDALVGDDGTARIVIATTKGRAAMLRVREAKPMQMPMADGYDYDGFTCNGPHLLVLSSRGGDATTTVAAEALYREYSRNDGDCGIARRDSDRLCWLRKAVGRFPLEFDFAGAVSAVTADALSVAEGLGKWVSTGMNAADIAGDLRRAAVALGMVDGRTAVDSVPPCVVASPSPIRSRFLRGVFGCAEQSTHTVGCLSSRLAQSIAMLARSLGHRASVYRRDSCFGVTIDRESTDTCPVEITQAAADGEYCGFRLGMVRSGIDELAVLRRIAAAGADEKEKVIRELILRGDVVCSGDVDGGCEVGGSDTDGRFPGRFLLGDFTVTHNSAILVAISLALGGRANFTQRGASVKDLIMHNETSATVAVHLSNRGADAFRPRDFGRTIVVERKLQSDGSGSYVMRNGRGKAVAHGVKNVRLMLEHFGIQVDNPCVLLMQDTAKQFLWKESEEAKYEFFLKATMLDRIVDEYSAATRSVDEADAMLAKKLKLLPRLRETVMDLEEELRALGQLDELAGKVESMKNELAWAWVARKKEAHAKADDTYTATRARLERVEASVADAAAKERDADERIRQLSEEAKAAAEAAAEYTAAKDGAREKIAEMRRDLIAKQSKARDLAKRAAQKEQQIVILARSLEEARKRDEEALTQQRDEFATQVAAKREVSERTAAERETAERIRAEREREWASAQQDAGAAARRLEDLRRQAEKLQDTARQLESARVNRLNGLGPSIPALVAKVEGALRARAFRGRVIGPICSHLALGDTSWAPAVESALRRDGLASFVVGCSEDAQTLGRLSRQCGCHVQVYTVAMKDHVYSMPDAPREGVLTLERVLRADDPNVMNVLIDHHRVQGVALARTRREAEAILDAGERGVSEVYTAQGDRVFRRGESSAFFPGRDKPVWFNVDYDAQIAAARSQRAELDPQLREADAAKALAERAVKEARDRLQSATSAADLARSAANRAAAQLSQLEAMGRRRDEQQQQQADLAETEAQLQGLRESADAIHAEVEAAKADAAAAEEAMRPAMAESEERERAGRAIVEKVSETRDRLSKPLLLRKKLAGQKLEAESALARTKREAEDRARELADRRAEVERAVEQARELCAEEIVTRRTPEELSREIDTTERELRRSRNQSRQPEAVEKELGDAREQLERVERSSGKIGMLMEEMRSALGKRREKLEDMRVKMTKRVRMLFAVILRKRQCSGDLIIDHERRSLKIVLRMDTTGDKGQQRTVVNTKTLSGGERSFSTNALLIALWEAFESPFCALDEFDVYMDAINRKMAIKTLLDVALTYSRRQYIIITPQTDIDLVSTDQIKIKRLKPPVRGQLTLDDPRCAPAPAATADGNDDEED